MSERLLHHGASFQPNHRHPTPPRPYGYIPSHRLPHPPRLLFLPPYFPPTPTRQVVSLLLTPRYSTSTNPSRLFPYSSLHPRHTQDPERGGYEPESRLPRPRKPQLVQDCTQRFSIQPDTLTEDRFTTETEIRCVLLLEITWKAFSGSRNMERVPLTLNSWLENSRVFGGRN